MSPAEPDNGEQDNPRIIRLHQDDEHYSPVGDEGVQSTTRRQSPRVFRWLWSIGVWFADRRRVPARPQDYERFVYRSQTRGMGLRMTEYLRDRLRPRWLKLRRPQDHPRSD